MLRNITDGMARMELDPPNNVPYSPERPRVRRGPPAPPEKSQFAIEAARHARMAIANGVARQLNFNRV